MSLTSPSRHLSGQYKDFFEPSAHVTVEHWYLNEASPDLRNKMKQVVQKVLSFDLEAAKKGLRTTYDPDIIKANAIFEKNNGYSLISKNVIEGTSTSYQQKTVQWLSFSSVIEQNMFRATIGMMQPPNRFTSHRHVDDFDPAKKYWKTETQIGDHKSVLCGNLLHKPSEMHEIECETIAKHSTQTGSQFSWKLAASKAAREAQAGGAFKSVSQRAHDATYKGAPWGVYGTPGDVKANHTQWVSQTKEDFADTFFVQDSTKRRYQNYNDNYIGLLSKQYTDQQKAAKAAAKSLKNTQASQQSPLPETSSGLNSPPGAASFHSAASSNKLPSLSKK